MRPAGSAKFHNSWLPDWRWRARFSMLLNAVKPFGYREPDGCAARALVRAMARRSRLRLSWES
eukprot:13865937-Heterocapsa_arctica.AAC.1